MAGFVFLGLLAAFGALCACWVLVGLVIPRPKGGALVYDCTQVNEEMILRRYGWLRELGCLQCPLVLVESRLPEHRRRQVLEKMGSVYFYTLEQWIEQERRQIGRAGNGDAAGDHHSGGLSEL